MGFWTKCFMIAFLIFDIILFIKVITFVSPMNFIKYTLSMMASMAIPSYYFMKVKKVDLVDEIEIRQGGAWLGICYIIATLAFTLLAAKYSPYLAGIVSWCVMGFLLMTILRPEFSYISYIVNQFYRRNDTDEE